MWYRKVIIIQMAGTQIFLDEVKMRVVACTSSLNVVGGAFAFLFRSSASSSPSVGEPYYSPIAMPLVGKGCVESKLYCLSR